MSQFHIPENLAISNSGFLFLPSSGESFTLNEIGKEIFKLLQSGSASDEIINKIISEYEIDKSTFEKDLDDFIAQLKTFYLIKEL
jgi:hypothetical protein